MANEEVPSLPNEEQLPSIAEELGSAASRCARFRIANSSYRRTVDSVTEGMENVSRFNNLVSAQCELCGDDVLIRTEPDNDRVNRINLDANELGQCAVRIIKTSAKW